MHKRLKQILLDVLKVQSESYNVTNMNNFIMNFVNDLGLEVVYDEGNLYITKGIADDYPCMVSHTDTVHKIIKDEHYTIITNDKVAMGYDLGLMQPTGCGGDDKVGIAICLMMLERLDYVKVAFFRDEEVGCVGSYDANLEFFDNTRFVLQCDRRGNSDFVNDIYGTPLQSKSFKRDVKHLLSKYGYKPTDGMLTDVYALKQQGLGVSVANMSCGYYNPHDDNETVVFADVFNCFDLCYEIMTSMNKVYKHKANISTNRTTYGNYNKYNSHNGWDDWYDSGWDYTANKGWVKKDEAEDCMVCDYCTSVVDIKDIVYDDSYDCYLCASCVKDMELDHHHL